MFQELPNRDAWGTIRGYVYQVDLTILRWLNIKGAQTVLQLEKGEDIDIVNQNIIKGEISRELEQVKYREKDITLNSDFVLEILLNFFIQKVNNPTSNLYFRFVTNADYTVERPAIFQKTGEAGIKAWIRLFNDQTLTDTHEDLLFIKKHLRKKVQTEIDEQSKVKKPKEDYLKDLDKFNIFLQQTDGFAIFLKSFDWSLRNNDAPHISSTIKDSLISKNYATDTQTADDLYSRLFLYVFKLLTISGLKQLTQHDLQLQLEKSELDTGDKELLQHLVGLFGSLEGRVSELEKTVIVNTQSLNTLMADYEILSKADAVFDLKIKTLSVSPPPPIRNGSIRKTKVEFVLKKFENKSWIAFHGINGTGKSQLAALVCLQFKNHYWLELRPFYNDPEKTAILLLKFFEYISGELISRDRNAWLRNVIKNLPDNTLLVFNDLLQIPKDSTLAELIAIINNSVTGTNTKILTTSNYQIPQFVKEHIEESGFEECNDFKFSQDEIIEYLVNNGADSTIVNYISLISAVTDNNPRLLGAVIVELKRINWGKDSEELFDVFFKNNFKAEIIADAQNSIKRFILNDQSRELLYRLSLINWAFSFEDVQNISLVKNEISHPNEKLSDIINIWIQEQRDKLYQVSPLIYDLGEKNLTKDVLENTYLAIANSLIQGKKVDQITASRSIIAFLKGKDFLSAGGILLNIYQSVKKASEIEYLKDWGFLDYWTTTEIPIEMPVMLRGLIRNEQIRLARFQKKENYFLILQQEKYLTEKELKSSEKILLHFMIISNFDGSDIENHWTHLEAIISLWPEVPQGYKDLISEENLLNILWLPITNLNRDIDIKRWLNIISKYEGVFKQNFFKHEFSETAIAALSHNISNTKLTGVSNESILSLYEFLSKYFKEKDEEVLEALMVRAIVENTFQIQNKVEDAQALAIGHIALFKNVNSKFILTDVLGKLYWNIKKIDSGREWLFRAVDFQSVDQVNFVETLLYAATAISEIDTQRAEEYCSQAVTITENKEDYHELDCIQALSELGLACYNNKNFIESFNSFERAALRLFSIKEKVFASENRFYKQVDWIRLYVLLGHTLGYISNKLVHDKLPQKDGEDFSTPFQGLFFFNKNDLSDLYKITNDPLLMSEMALFAEGVDDIKKSYSWSLKAFDLARRNGRDDVFLMVSAMCSQYSLVNGKYDEAFESNLLFSAVSAHLKGKPEEKYTGIGNTTIAEVIKSKPSAEWNGAEDTTISSAVIPMLIQILIAKITSDNSAPHKQELFLQVLKNYQQDSSDKELWQELYSLSRLILNRTISIQELIKRGNAYGDKERKNLHIICILGLIYINHKAVSTLKEILNIYPYFSNMFDGFITTKKYILVPFLKLVCEKVLADNFVGNRMEYENILKQFQQIEATTSNSYQLILQSVVNCFKDEVKITENRGKWLFDFEKI